MTVFDEIHKGLPEKEFPKSNKTIEKRYCRETGKLAGSNCGSTGKGWYKIDSLPAVCTTCTGTPGDEIGEAVSNAVGEIAGNLSGILNEIVGEM